MIICHEHKYIFVKTEKTAGTSIEIALAEHCGESDVITPISDVDEKMRRDLGYRGPQHYQAPLSSYSFPDVKRLVRRRKRKQAYFNHMPASRIKELAGSEIWDTYYKFTFERNPWDKVISWYYWNKKFDDVGSVTDFIDSGRAFRVRGIELYSIDGEIAVDKIARFENLKGELAEVTGKLGMPTLSDLPRAKSGARKDKRHYSEMYSDADRKKVADFYAREIDLLGYEFGK